MATNQRLSFRRSNEERRRHANDPSRSSPMSFARQVELVDLSNSRTLRPRNTGYTPRESLFSSPSSSSSSLNPPYSPTSPSSNSQPASSTPNFGSSLLTPTPNSSIPLTSSPLTTPTKSQNNSSAPPYSTALHNHDVNKATAQLAHVLSETKLTSTDNSRPPYANSVESQLSEGQSIRLTNDQRDEMFRECLSASSVDVDELRRLIWAHGLPTSSGIRVKSRTPWIRPLVWKLLTGYLPPDRADWTSTLANSRAQYWALVHDATIDPSERPVDGDHPLNDEDSSQWREFFEDADIRSLISRDSKRTYPELDKNEGEHGLNMSMIREALDRLLFVYAKTYPDLGYRQGMNELAVIFLIVFFAEDGSNRNTNHVNNLSSPSSNSNNIGARIDASDVEADAYFCFQSVMNEMETCYVKDSENDGIGKQLRELQALLRIKDPQLEEQFEKLGIDPRFYGLRWLRLWVSREFPLEDCLLIWDSFLTAEVRLPWIRYVCVAMLIRIRNSLLQSDFTKCMKLLLHYPTCNIPQLLRIADELRTSNAVIVRTARR